MSPAVSHCPGCQQALRHAVLEGHYGKSVEVDLCTTCHLVWFDVFESVRLSGLGWLQLLRDMIDQPATSAVLPARMACVRCSAELVPARNQTRFGRTAALECRVGHGQLQTLTHLLAERGLLRAVLPADRSALARQDRSLVCMQCGAGDHAAGAEQCAYCSSPLLMVDLPRLASALLVRHGSTVAGVEGAKPLTLACQGCGQPLDPAGQAQCPRCYRAAVWTELRSIRPLLDAVEPLLRATPARKPLGPWEGRQPGDYRATQFHRTLGLFKSAFGKADSTPEGDLPESLPGHLAKLVLGLVLMWLLFGGWR